jgi:hypothetical protein
MARAIRLDAAWLDRAGLGNWPSSDQEALLESLHGVLGGVLFLEILQRLTDGESDEFIERSGRGSELEDEETIRWLEHRVPDVGLAAQVIADKAADAVRAVLSRSDRAATSWSTSALMRNVVSELLGGGGA